MKKEGPRESGRQDAAKHVQDELARFGYAFQVFDGGPEEIRMLAELKAREEGHGPCTKDSERNK